MLFSAAKITASCARHEELRGHGYGGLHTWMDGTRNLIGSSGGKRDRLRVTRLKREPATGGKLTRRTGRSSKLPVGTGHEHVGPARGVVKGNRLSCFDGNIRGAGEA